MFAAKHHAWRAHHCGDCADAHTDAHPDAHTDAHTHPDANTDANAHTDADADAHTHPDANTDTNANANHLYPLHRCLHVASGIGHDPAQRMRGVRASGATARDTAGHCLWPGLNLPLRADPAGLGDYGR